MADVAPQAPAAPPAAPQTPAGAPPNQYPGLDKFIQSAFGKQAPGPANPVTAMSNMSPDEKKAFGELVGSMGNQLIEMQRQQQGDGNLPIPQMNARANPTPVQSAPPWATPILPQGQHGVPGTLPQMKLPPATSPQTAGVGASPQNPFSVKHFETGTPNAFGVR